MIWGERPRNILSIAGSDPSGGAGIQADLKTFAALGCHGMAAITALTAQNTTGVSAVHLPPPGFVAEQIRMVLADVEVHAVKIGMLGSAAIAEAVAGALRDCQAPVVVDPVLVATSGAALGDDAVVGAMRQHLFPRAALVTPNLAEAARLTDADEPVDENGMRAAAALLRGQSPAAWLIKGGHAGGAEAVDIMLGEGGFLRFAAPRIATRNTHGTGCTLSAAIAAGLGRDLTLGEAVAAAKAYLTEALAGADRLAAGRGPGPLDHFARWRSSGEAETAPAPCAVATHDRSRRGA